MSRKEERIGGKKNRVRDSGGRLDGAALNWRALDGNAVINAPPSGVKLHTADTSNCSRAKSILIALSSLRGEIPTSANTAPSFSTRRRRGRKG